MRILALTLVASTLFCVSASADWPQFLGPNRDGVSTETNLARSWPEQGPPVLWTVPLGPGFGAPAVHDGNLYLLDRIGEQQDVLRCFDLQSGRELWQFAYDAPGKVDYPGSRATPAVDENYVFTIGPFGHVHCIDKSTHQPLWTANLLSDYEANRPRWGVSQSPLLYNEWVIIAPLGKQAGVIAFDKATGREVWKTPALGSLEYASPMVVTLDGVDHIIVMSNQDRGNTAVTGIDALSGNVLWTYSGWNCRIPIASPTHLGEGKFFITGGYRAGSATIQVRRQGDQWTAAELTKDNVAGSQIHNALLYKGHLYLNANDTKESLMCLTLDGQTKWKTGDSPSFDIGGLIIADDLIFALDGRSGTLRLIAADPEAYNEIASVKLLDGPEAWAPLVISNGKLIIRDKKQMKCLDVKATQ